MSNIVFGSRSINTLKYDPIHPLVHRLIRRQTDPQTRTGGEVNTQGKNTRKQLSYKEVTGELKKLDRLLKEGKTQRVVGKGKAECWRVSGSKLN